MTRHMNTTRTCRRCGTCCRMHSPALHHEDEPLYHEGILKKEHLVTFRKGEWVYDNVQDALMVLEAEMISIRPSDEHGGCLFLDQTAGSCLMYERRPVECRAMKCWDLKDILNLYSRDRLTRWDLIAVDSALGQIMAEHERQCAYARVAEICERLLEHEDQGLAKELAEIVQADLSFRAALQERTGAGEHTLNSVFGRSMTRTLPLFGLQALIGEQGEIRFKPEPMSRSRQLKVETIRRSRMKLQK